MKQISMYFKSDFTVILASEGEWGGCPFRIKLWTASPAEGRSIKACFDGEVWHNCRLLDDGRLQISVNQGDLGERQYMGIGTLKMDIEFYLTNADFNDHYCNEHIKTLDPVFEDENGEQYKLYLDNQGASTITTIGTLPAFYQRGEKGERGERGEQGLPGEQGPKGDKGDKGDRGEQGIQGVKGDTGPKGATGPQGQRGIQGIQGRKGETGETGATGPQGERGLQGEKGEKGEPFHYSDFTPEQLEGLRGPRGYQGETGPAGPVGPQGPQGERGPKGDSVTMFPAVTIFGQPRIQETQMSEFSAQNYAQFPFLVDFAGRHWQLDCAITTGADVSQQHNVFDSAFGLAFAFKSGKFVLAMSSDGTSWNLGATSGTHNIAANTTYYIRITWDGANYVLAYSTDKVNWTNDITVASTESLASKQIIIGKSLDNAHIFNGSINFAEARLTIAGVIVWEGMEEVGTATRMALDMSNIDEAGKQKVNDIVGEGAVGQAIADLNARQGAYPAFPDIPLTLAVSGKVIGTDGQLVTKAGYGISAPVEVQKGNTYRFPSSEAIGGHALFAQVLTREVQYTITMQSYTEGTETRERIERISTMRGIGGIGRVYRCVYSGENDTIVGIWQDSAEDGYSQQYLPVVGWKYAIQNPKMLDGTPMTSQSLYTDITSAAGGQMAIRPSYTEYSPKFNANGVVSLTANGEYVLLSSFEGLMVVSGKLADLAEGKVLHQSRDGKDASMANQLAAKADVDMLALLYKRGVVSQTQTWYNENGTAISPGGNGDYHHYVMSNIQWGIIPQANIDLFLSAGAEFNDTDSPIEKTAPWGEKVQHLPGYFYLNGLGDISYGEMEEIANQPTLIDAFNAKLNFTGCYARTLLPYRNIDAVRLVNMTVRDGGNQMFSNSKLEVLTLKGFENYDIAFPKLVSYTFSFSPELWRVFNIEYVSDIFFSNVQALKYVNINKLNNSINFSVNRHLHNSSILYAIQHSTATKAITITLHHDAYTRAVNDPAILAALESKPMVTLACATHTDEKTPAA